MAVGTIMMNEARTNRSKATAVGDNVDVLH